MRGVPYDWRMVSADSVFLESLRKSVAADVDAMVWETLEKQVAEVGVLGLTGTGRALVEGLVRKHGDHDQKNHAGTRGGGGSLERINQSDFKGVASAGAVAQGDRVLMEESGDGVTVAVRPGTVRGTDTSEGKIFVSDDNGASHVADYWNVMLADSMQKHGGDHDESDHGNWAKGGGKGGKGDKEGKGKKGKKKKPEDDFGDFAAAMIAGIDAQQAWRAAERKKPMDERRPEPIFTPKRPKGSVNFTLDSSPFADEGKGGKKGKKKK